MVINPIDVFCACVSPLSEWWPSLDLARQHQQHHHHRSLSLENRWCEWKNEISHGVYAIAPLQCSGWWWLSALLHLPGHCHTLCNNNKPIIICRSIGSIGLVATYLWKVSDKRAMNRLSMRMAERASHVPMRRSAIIESTCFIPCNGTTWKALSLKCKIVKHLSLSKVTLNFIISS